MSLSTPALPRQRSPLQDRWRFIFGGCGVLIFKRWWHCTPQWQANYRFASVYNRSGTNHSDHSCIAHVKIISKYVLHNRQLLQSSVPNAWLYHDSARGNSLSEKIAQHTFTLLNQPFRPTCCPTIGTHRPTPADSSWTLKPLNCSWDVQLYTWDNAHGLIDINFKGNWR